MEVKNGETTSFRYDSWNSLGCLHETLGERGYIDRGNPKATMLNEVMKKPRKRKHRRRVLNLVEEELQKQRQARLETESDVALWKGKNDCYQQKFLSKETWS